MKVCVIFNIVSKNGIEQFSDITFRQISIHDVDNICTAINENISITFNINYRNSKQKSASRLGCAKFYFSTFDLTRNLTCNRGLIVQLNDSTPVVLGVLKISVQLGCGRLYFGKEFLQAVNTNNTKSIVLDSDDSACQSAKSAPIVHKRNERMTKEPPKNEQKSKSTTHSYFAPVTKFENTKITELNKVQFAIYIRFSVITLSFVEKHFIWLYIHIRSELFKPSYKFLHNMPPLLSR